MMNPSDAIDLGRPSNNLFEFQVVHRYVSKQVWKNWFNISRRFNLLAASNCELLADEESFAVNCSSVWLTQTLYCW